MSTVALWSWTDEHGRSWVTVQSHEWAEWMRSTGRRCSWVAPVRHRFDFAAC